MRRIEDKMSSVYSFPKMPSLVEAHMSTTGRAAELLTCLSSVKTLTLTYSTLDVCFLILRKFTILTDYFNCISNVLITFNSVCLPFYLCCFMLYSYSVLFVSTKLVMIISCVWLCRLSPLFMV